MNIITTIVPIFAIIILGWVSHRKGFIPSEFIGPANSLVFYMAIPAMVFNAVAKASLRTHFDLSVLLLTLCAVVAGYAMAWASGALKRLKGGQLGTYIQSGFHGNLGYIGLAVAYYYLGEEGFVKTSILLGAMMILQNFLSVLALTLNSDKNSGKRDWAVLLRKIVGNPVIVSALVGIVFSLAEIPVPLVVERSLDILSGLALPMALLIIGGSISFDLIRHHMRLVFSTMAIKLVFLPGLGFALYRLFGLSAQEFLPGLILLASPAATISYVMAKEMGGDPDFAAASISASTLLSSITYTIWLNLAA
ncbi:MAG: AEC family transporter [Deltaproteobacteria bacterium]|nr:AEC family transporter [Deltaproteobacteria bacterium]MBW2634940.1 AEC family transporter [Deltaproteobacteria bacterium]MBW2677084.1 AEC family transporter [Deltaproteobacteria bacterium]